MEQAPDPAESIRQISGSPVGHFRWVICALLFFATTINYLDRIVLNIMAPDLQKSIGWSEAEYGYINMAFTLAYAVGLLLMGRVMDRFGTRRGFAFSISFWSLAAMAHSLARSWAGFAAARFALAVGEAGNFPGAVKTIAEWFPKKERALATGIFNSGANVGLLIAPIMVPFILEHTGHWQWVFVFTGAVGFIWLAFWLTIARSPDQHPGVFATELATIRSSAPEPTAKIPFLALLPHRQAWAFAVGKLLTDPVWWVVFTFWLAKYLNATYHLKLTGLMWPLVVIYLAADVGSIAGGWISSRLLALGWSANAARKTAMLLCAMCALPLFLAPHVHNLWFTVSLIALAAAAHQGWSANLFTLVSDMFPRRAVGSVVGFGGMFGGFGGVLASFAAGWALQLTITETSPNGNYNPILYAAALLYLSALLIIHLLVPRLEPARLQDTEMREQ
jgi:ACS family hexuronate transporter-like MFS transporter